MMLSQCRESHNVEHIHDGETSDNTPSIRDEGSPSVHIGSFTPSGLSIEEQRQGKEKASRQCYPPGTAIKAAAMHTLARYLMLEPKPALLHPQRIQPQDYHSIATSPGASTVPGVPMASASKINRQFTQCASAPPPWELPFY
eukprot:427955-Pelagomonas_calceolata.AAC.2